MKRVTDIFSKTFNEHEQNKFDYKVVVICFLTAVCLTMNKYLPEMKIFFHFSENEQLSQLGNWVFVLFTFYFIVPALVIKFLFKENLSDYGLRWKGAFKDYWLYIVMLCVMIPLVAFFSTTASFQARYPFYDLAQGEKLYHNFWIWEAFYFLQFFALEFFFRGFMTHGLKKRFGFYSVFVMTIPYCMIHFGKPFTETLAAIIAGMVLGCLSLKNKSIIVGFLIHVSVGLGMDMAAIWQKGFFE